MLPDLKRQARLQHTIPEAQPGEGQLTLCDSHVQTLEPYRANFREKESIADQATVQVQLARLEVQRQREVAHKEREGLHYHDGYKMAVKAFIDAERAQNCASIRMRGYSE